MSKVANSACRFREQENRTYLQLIILPMGVRFGVVVVLGKAPAKDIPFTCSSQAKNTSPDHKGASFTRKHWHTGSQVAYCTSNKDLSSVRRQPDLQKC